MKQKEIKPITYLILTTDENDNDVFGSQDIEDLTESSDILGGNKNE